MSADFSAHLKAIPPYEVANRRTERDFRWARHYSRAVRALRLVLPALAVMLVVAFGAITAFSYSPLGNISIGAASLKDGKLVMETPKMAGFDSKNRPYDVKARRALQDLKTPNLIELEAIDAVLPMDESGSTKLVAEQGIYDTEAETLQLRDNIRITGARGMDIALQSADIDMKAGSLQSLQPVSVTSNDATIRAQKVFVEDNGKRIVFRDRVRMTIKRAPASGTNEAAAAQQQATGQ